MRADWATAAIFLCFVAGSPPVPAAEELILTPADNSSPRTTLQSFNDNCEAIYEMFLGESRGEDPPSKEQTRALVEELLRNLDLSQLPDFSRRTTGKEAAACIKEILDRVELPPIEEIPGPDELVADTDSGFLERWRVPGTDLVIHRVTEGPRNGDYLFSPDSVAMAIRDYDQVRSFSYKEGASRDFYAWYLTHPGTRIAPLVNLLPEGFRTRLIGHQSLWQWIALAIAVVIGFAAIVLAYYFGRKLASKRRETSVIRYGFTLLYPIFAMLVPLVFIHVVREEIRIAGSALAFFTFSANLIVLLGGMIVINGLGSRIAEFIISNPRIPSKGLDAQLIRVISRVLSLVLAVIVFLEGGRYLGIPLGTLLASAGVGGLAFALAAQDSLKNFFGSIMIYMDKPYRIGERIVVKSYDGIVEEIGLRSTRLRLLNGHQATIPNEEMARSDIENVSRRPHIRRLADIRLPIDTPPEKAEKGVEIIREILKDHEGMEPDFPPRAYFTDIHPDYLNLRFLYWYHPPNYWDFLEFSQGVNLRIQREFAEAGVRLEAPMKLLDLTGSVLDGESEEIAKRPTSGTDAPSN